MDKSCIFQKFRKLAWITLLQITVFFIISGIWDNLPQKRFRYALGTEYHKEMKLLSLKTFSNFNNCYEVIAGTFFSSKEIICDKPLNVSSNRRAVLKKAEITFTNLRAVYPM